MIAVAGALIGAAMPAKAADLGGGCCGDLEERVAELEATVARKGNRVVSLQVYGEIATALLIFDNGKESDALVVDNDAITSRVGFKGESTIKPGLKAGYKAEFAFQKDSSSAVTEAQNGDDATNFTIRHNFVYIESERFGRISLGQTSTTSDGASGVSIANTLAGPSPDVGTALTPGGVAAVGIATTLGGYASDFGTSRNDIVRYDSPTIYGFTASASWGDNDFWDVALRFAKEFNSVKVAAAIAYADSQQTGKAAEDFTQVIGSATAMHVPTGLFIMGAFGDRDYDNGVNGTFWFAQGGIERKWLPYGATTVYVEYGSYEDVAVAGTTADMWGLGVVQHIDAASMDVYAQARFWDTEDNSLAGVTDGGDLSTILIGAHITF